MTGVMVLLVAAFFFRCDGVAAEGELFDQMDVLMVAPVVSAGQGLPYFVMMIRGRQEMASFEDTRLFLMASGYLASNVVIKENTPLTKGLLAALSLSYLGIKGGVGLRLCGVSERRALAEMVFRKLIVSGSTGETLSGLELMSISRRVCEYKKERANP